MIGYRDTHRSRVASISHSTSTSTTTNPASVLNETALVPKGEFRTLADVRDQVAREVAIRAITKAETLDGVRIGVSLTLSKNDDEGFLRTVTEEISHQMVLHEHLFIVASTMQSVNSSATTLFICGSTDDYVERAVLLASSKFIGRIVTAKNEHKLWIATVLDIGLSTYDEDALWDVVRKSAKSPIDPLLPPPGSRSIDQILCDARTKLQRITAKQAFDELRETRVGAPTFLVDIRPAAQRERYGGIHGSLIIERNVLEWRFDPRSDSRLSIADRYDLRVIVFCQEGYTSSLAAYSLQQLGILNATDIIGGYEAWRLAGLPIDAQTTPEPRSLVSLAGSVV